MYLMTSPPPIPEPTNFHAGPPLVLDLGGIESLSAAGIGELVSLRSRLHASGGQLVLVNVGDHVRRAIEESRLTEAFNVRCNGHLRPALDDGEAAERGDGVGRACGKE